MKTFLLLALLATVLPSLARAATAPKTKVEAPFPNATLALNPQSGLHTQYRCNSAAGEGWRKCNYYRGYDTSGGDYRSFRAASQASCCAKCWSDSRCYIWVYKNSSKTCWLQDNSGSMQSYYGYNSGKGFCSTQA
jgi:hypothetical protein